MSMPPPKPPIVDRAFAEKFLVSVDRPLDYGVYFLFHDWWEGAPQAAIDGYMAELHAVLSATDFLKARYIAEPMTVAGLKRYEPGTLGHAYREFVVCTNLLENFGRDYRKIQAELQAKRALKRMPDDIA